jgi:hypothetical protein
MPLLFYPKFLSGRIGKRLLFADPEVSGIDAHRCLGGNPDLTEKMGEIGPG